MLVVRAGWCRWAPGAAGQQRRLRFRGSNRSLVHMCCLLLSLLSSITSSISLFCCSLARWSEEQPRKLLSKVAGNVWLETAMENVVAAGVTRRGFSASTAVRQGQLSSASRERLGSRMDSKLEARKYEEVASPAAKWKWQWGLSLE